MSNNPYNSTRRIVHAKKSPQKSPWFIISIVGGVIAFGAFLCCGGGFAFFWYFSSSITAQVRAAIEHAPEMEQNLGQVEKFTVNWTRTGDEPGENVFVYDIKGTKGKGYVRVEHVTDEDGNEVVIWAELRMNDRAPRRLTIR
ncbi:MAG: hypothetical protein R3C03_23815 [Pirellulaceae bacterium]